MGGEQRLEVILNMIEFSPLTSCTERSKGPVCRAQISVPGLPPTNHVAWASYFI